MKWNLWVSAVLILAAPANAQISGDLSGARDLFLKEQYKTALPLAEKAVQNDSTSVPARILLAQIHLRLEKPDQALESLALVTSADPKSLDGWKLTGEAHMLQAVQELRKWLKDRGSDMLGLIPSAVPTVHGAGPDRPAELIVLPEGISRSAMNPKEWERLEKPVLAAVEAYNKALALNGTDAVAQNGAGLASMLKGDWTAAANAFEKAPTVDRFHVVLYDVADGAHGTEQRSGEMMRMLEAIVRHDPAHPWANLYLRDMYWHTRKGHWMGTYYNAAHMLFSNIEDTSDARKYGPKDALKELEKVTSEQPDFARGWWAMGRAALGAKDNKRGVEALKKAADLAPDDATLQYDAGVILLQNKDESAARRYLTRAAKARPVHPHTWFYLGTLAESAKDTDTAVVCYEKAVQQSPNWADARFNLGALLLDLRRGSEALPHLERYVELNPKAKNVPDIQKALDQLKKILAPKN